MKAVVGLGTNLGDRVQNLRDALASIGSRKRCSAHCWGSKQGSDVCGNSKTVRV